MHHEPTNSLGDKLRMVIWLLAGIALYALAHRIGAIKVYPTDAGMPPIPAYPIAQVACQKLANITTCSWFGYWFARQALGRLTTRSPAGDRQARAIVIGAAIVAGALGI